MRVFADKKRLFAIGSGADIGLQMQLGSCIEINLTLFVALTKNNALAFVVVDVGTVEQDQFADTHTGRGEKVDNGEVAWGATVVTHTLKLFVGERFLDLLLGTDFMDLSNWRFNNIVFIFKPCEETAEDATHIVDSDVRCVGRLLIFCKIGANMVGGDVLKATRMAADEMCNN